MRTARIMAAAAALLFSACGDGTPAVREPVRTTGVVDSAVPREEALRRFREGLEPVDTLAGPADRDSLVHGFVAALASSDTARLGELLIDRREFAWLFYPTTPQGHPPYDVAPQLMWELLLRQSDRGLADALTRIGGRPLELVSYGCGEEPAVEGMNRVWGPCTLTLAIPGRDTVAGRLTGPILERNGRFRFLSYTNELD